MRYPYMVWHPEVEIQPLFAGLAGAPFVTDMSVGASVFDAVDVLDQQAFQAWLDTSMKGRFTWGLASYLENREAVLTQFPQMRKEQRYFHLGLDIIVPLGTPLCAPLDAVVAASDYEEGEGNYGGNVLLRHDSPFFETFYSLYGHLNREKLPASGTRFAAGETFAWIGDFHENGNWFYHTHLQVITQKGYDEGWISKGYCSAADLAVIDRLCPNPLSLFRV